jgi:hypothetical protein
LTTHPLELSSNPKGKSPPSRQRTKVYQKAPASNKPTTKNGRYV